MVYLISRVQRFEPGLLDAKCESYLSACRPLQLFMLTKNKFIKILGFPLLSVVQITISIATLAESVRHWIKKNTLPALGSRCKYEFVHSYDEHTDEQSMTKLLESA